MRTSPSPLELEAAFAGILSDEVRHSPVAPPTLEADRAFADRALEIGLGRIERALELLEGLERLEREIGHHGQAHAASNIRRLVWSGVDVIRRVGPA